MSPPAESETREADLGQLQGTECHSQGTSILQQNQDLHPHFNGPLCSQYTGICMDCGLTTLCVSLCHWLGHHCYQNISYPDFCSSLCWNIIIKQFTDEVLLCVMNTHDPYQGHRDLLSFSYYINKHELQAAHFYTSHQGAVKTEKMLLPVCLALNCSRRVM